jgi:hypothetical protein
MATPIDDNRSIGDLLGEATSELSHLFRQEVELAKLELKRDAKEAADSAKFFGIAGGAAFFALLLISFAIAWGLAEIMPIGVAFLIVGVVYAAVAAVTFVSARKRLDDFNAVPEETVETLKEDVQWLKARKNNR